MSMIKITAAVPQALVDSWADTLEMTVAMLGTTVDATPGMAQRLENSGITIEEIAYGVWIADQVDHIESGGCLNVVAPDAGCTLSGGCCADHGA